MARSQNNDPRYSDHTWNYCAENVDSCAAPSLHERARPGAVAANDGLYMGAPTFASNDIYGKRPYSMGVETAAREDLAPRAAPPYAVLDLGNGQLVHGYYDKNNQRLMIPVTGQYELFNPGPGLHELPAAAQSSHMFALNQEYPDNSVHMVQPTPVQQSFVKDNQTVPTSNFLKEVLGNWEPNSTGTYSPFGQNYPLKHPDVPTMSVFPNNSSILESQVPTNIVKLETNSPKRSDPLAETSSKKRIVAEVKPMRPSYSDVLAKNKNNVQPEINRQTKSPITTEAKVTSKINNTKPDKHSTPKSSDEKPKTENKKQHMTSSGSESGDITNEDTEKPVKPAKKNKNRRNISHEWTENTKEDSLSNSPNSQFVYIESNTEKPVKKDKKSNEVKEKPNKMVQEEALDDDDEDQSQFVLHDSQADALKAKKKKESRNHSTKALKPVVDKKKVIVSKWRRSKPGYVGLAQSYLEHWGGASWKAVVWFLYLLSDICRMSAHLSFDLCTSVFTATYVSSQAVWRSGKERARRLASHKYLLYIDRKLGHTRVGFWRKLKWYKKDGEADGEGECKLNSNIPMPQTGEEAMKRLLACKGKDPYNILGVSAGCADEEIRRYYRRQAFLVHPDKNPQPGAEEAFKILQHAFNLIGEPDRREMYDRCALEARHVEAAWGELSQLLAQLHDKMEFAANTIRCTNCGRRHKRVLTDRPCYAARYCAQCKIRHSAKEGDIWAESSMMGLLVMYYACMDGAVYQITQWASCQKRNLRQLRPDCHVVQYRIVLGNKAADSPRPQPHHDQSLEDFLNNLYKTGGPGAGAPPAPDADAKRRRNKKPKA